MLLVRGSVISFDQVGPSPIPICAFPSVEWKILSPLAPLIQYSLHFCDSSLRKDKTREKAARSVASTARRKHPYMAGKLSKLEPPAKRAVSPAYASLAYNVNDRVSAGQDGRRARHCLFMGRASTTSHEGAGVHLLSTNRYTKQSLHNHWIVVMCISRVINVSDRDTCTEACFGRTCQLET
jgi:hypothetical protein